MTQSSDNIILVKAPALKTLVGKIFSQAGSNPRESELVADHLVEANLRGHDSHGVGMIPLYITNLGLGEAVLNVHPTVMRDLETMVVLDGGLGLGQSIAHEAMEIGSKGPKSTAPALSHCETAIISAVSAIGLNNAPMPALSRCIS